ncbi:HAD family hydrolase [Erwinia pyri]|uniref:HAD family hydrolase n=1 Tax=Erwinia pyri TaxID=3062598 RepID=A0AA50DLA4_9GAMM|nr:HAD family hydrolase [Erwinia sp. DE2]WLS79842.1 HAD family hydrolase [Erwinia sp. DE2]
MNAKQTIIMFDLDGTLFDTAQAIPMTFNAAFRALNVKELSPHIIKETIGLPLEKAFSLLMKLPVTDQQISLAVEEYQRQFKVIILPAAKSLLFPKVVNGLETLKRSGLRLSVTTNKFSRSANTLLAAAGIAHFFDIVVCADEVQKKKPHPESGQKILDYFEVEKSQAVMVGDTTHDILMATNLGCESIAVTYGIHDESTLRSASPGALAHGFNEVV